MIRFFLNKPIVSHFIFAAVVVFGFMATQKMPVEEMPTINLDFAIIVTLYPGASPAEVERLISVPVEDAIANVEDIDFINSRSQNGKSVVFVRFYENIKDYDKRIMDIQTEINKIPDLPDKKEMAGPFVYKIATGDTAPILNVMLSSETVTYNEFKDIAENLQRELSSKVKGIKNIQVAGVAAEEVAVYVDNDALLTYQLSVDDIFAVLMANNFRMPGGKLDITGKRFLVKTSGSFKNVSQIENVVVKKGFNGTRLLLKEVADVKKKFVTGGIESYLNTQKAVSLYIMRKPDANIVTINKEVKAAVNEFAKRYEDIDVAFRNDQGEMINETISVLRNNALLGMVLVSILLFFFMGWRASFLAVIGIPFAFLATFFLMNFFGYTINSLSLFAMILVSGMLVDDAIVVIENVYRYREDGYSAFDAALKGTHDIIWPVIAAIATTVSAFLPLLLISGMMGKFLSQLPVIVTFTLLASLIEAIVVLPVHLFEMKKLYVSKEREKRRWFDLMVGKYKAGLRIVINNKYKCFLLVLVVFGFSIYIAATQLKIVLFGREYTKVLAAKIELPENTPIHKTRIAIQKLEKFLLDEFHPDEVASVVAVVGRVIEDFRWITKESVAELRLDLSDYDEELATKVKNALRKQAASIPEIITFEFLAAPSGPPTGKPVDARVSGKDIKILEEIGDQIVKYLKEMKGVVDLRGSVVDKVNEIIVEPDMDKLNETGITLNQVAATIRAVTAGRYGGRMLNVDGRELNIWIKYDEQKTYTLNDIRDIPLKTRQGTMFRVRDVATIKEVQSLAHIRRRDRMREIKVSANIDYDMTTPYEVNKQLEEHFSFIPDRYPGYTINLRGEAEEQKKSFQDVAMAFLVAVVLIYIILGMQFNSFSQPFIIMVTLPFAFIGVALGLYVSNLPISLLALISLVALSGIVVNDSIILVDFINKFKDKMSIIDAVIEAGSKRLRPIILTTVTTVGGLMPMALFASGSNKAWQPMAITIIWGISFATLLTLFVIPIIYSIMHDMRRVFSRKKEKEIAST